MEEVTSESPEERQVKYRKIVNFMINYNFENVQENGQRITKPKNHALLPEPQQGCELFVGKIPHDIFEDELIPLFETVGNVYQFRLMVDFNGMNRGFAFVTYMNPRHADLAVESLNMYEIRHNRYIGVCKSIDNRRLHIGGIPVDKTREDVLKKLSETVEAVSDVIMYPAHIEGHVNRGYVFVEFSCHRMAALARRQLITGFVLWDNVLSVEWADPIPQVDPEIMNQVNKLYIRNLPVKLTEDHLRRILEGFLNDNSIVKVRKVNDYAFVKFRNRASAETALERFKTATCFHNHLEVTWARPAKYSKQNRLNGPIENFCLSVSPHMRKAVKSVKNGYGNRRTDSSSWGSSSAGFQQELPSTSF